MKCLLLIKYTLLASAFLILTGCATKKLYHGIPATDLSGLSFGLKRIAVEQLTGPPIMIFQCDSGTIITYVYDRGWTGCVGEGRCDPEDESKALAAEVVVGGLFTFGLLSLTEPYCVIPCQKGHLEVFYDDRDQLIGIRELPTYRDEKCWRRSNDKHLGYPCSRVYNHRQSSTIRKELILIIDQEDIPEKICDQFTK